MNTMALEWQRLAIVALLVNLGGSLSQSPCNFRQYIEPGRQFSVNNPGYPNRYGAYATCQWDAYTSAGAVVDVNCFRVDLAKNYWGSCLDYLTIATGSATTSYCQPFKVSANRIVMTLRGNNAAGGIFQCSFSARPIAPVPTPPPPQSCDCGWNRWAPRKRIVGGEETSVHEFPSMAAFINVIYKSMWCGATIISPTVALTAAHCTVGQNAAHYGLLVGEHDISQGSDSKDTQLLKVSRFIAHQAYDARTNLNDIALAITATPIVYSNNVGPACLPFLFDSATYRMVTVAGWGLDSYGGSTSDVLMKADLKIVPDSYCTNSYDAYNPQTQMCTYERGKDACQFDSGGPLYDYNTEKKQFVMGIVSYGKDCGRTDPAVNTKVSSFLNWIQSQLPNENFCKKP
ncbi:serine-type endopeptidase activity [Nesidiocoris tenuis]|uniref:Serine-type endopeptidase activity n=1 Tax=Nesidiocoris tenuis TaxID=355587 RepID=A0ABN7BHY7_9HEMI|nr:serine-type endopeptidase activity [Nesidiocoris tenuis]